MGPFFFVKNHLNYCWPFSSKNLNTNQITMSARADHRVSRSRSRSPGYTRRHSRSRSRSGSPYQSRGGQSGYGGGGAGPSRSRRRDHSRSPMSSRRRHVGSRDAPESSNCLGVFGISLYTTERELEKEFSKFGPLEKVTVVLDGKPPTVRSRGFAFIYFESQEDAKAAKEAMSDQEIDGRRIRVDFSITKRAHTPTPGVYMGRPTYRGGGGGGSGGDRYSGGDGDRYGGGRGGSRYGGGGGGGYGRRRSPSPYYRGGGGGGRRD